MHRIMLCTHKVVLLILSSKVRLQNQSSSMLFSGSDQVQYQVPWLAFTETRTSTSARLADDHSITFVKAF